jgi:hypothetical protein
MIALGRSIISMKAQVDGFGDEDRKSLTGWHVSNQAGMVKQMIKTVSANARGIPPQQTCQM